MKKATIFNASWEIIKMILSASIGFLFAYMTFSKQYDATEKGRLNENLNKILDINLQYPFVDDPPLAQASRPVLLHYLISSYII